VTSIPTGLLSAGDTNGSSFDLLPLAVLVLDADLRAVDVNGGWQQLCGRSPHDARGSLWWRSVDARDRSALRRALSSTASPEDQQEEHRVLGPDGPRWTRWWWQQQGDRTWVCIADVNAARSRAHELWQRATHDPLTGLANRAEFLALLERALERASDHPALTVVFVDLDRFKDVNDTSGHRAGDAVLAAVAQAIVESVRPFDVAARIGGDEFAVLCPSLTTDDEAAALAGRIRAAVAGSEATTGIAMSASVGVAVSRAGDTPDSLMVTADGAMYRDKAGGRATGSLQAASRAGRAAGVAPPDEEQLAFVLVPLLFRISLSLHAAADVADRHVAAQLHDVVDEIDDVIALLRRSAFANLRHASDGESVRTAFAGLQTAITGAEEAVRREWGNAGSPEPGGEEAVMRLVRSSRLLRAAERALEPDVLG
jgi:diguanylate cyclase (GGDEF)-like protein